MQLHSDQISADACNSLFEVLIMALQTDTMQTDNHADETSEFVGSAEEVPKAMPQPQIVPKTASNLTDMALDIFANVRGLRRELEISELACQTMCEVVEEVVNRWAVAAVETGEGSAQTEECVVPGLYRIPGWQPS